MADALGAGRPVVALESTLLAHGLPRPDNRAAADEVEAAVRAGGAVPATIAVLDGVPHVGPDGASRWTGCAPTPTWPSWASATCPIAAALGMSGATTVSSTALLAAAAGIGVFATGGLGGVHRHANDTFDESADLTALSRTSLVVVCAGVKSILDVPATLERLESLSVTVVGYGTTTFPGFYVADSGSSVDWAVDDPAQAAAVFAARRRLAPGAVVVANPLPADEQLDPALHDRVIADALAAADAAGVRGKDVTPFVLDHLHRASDGATLAVNVRLVLRNAELAGRIAAALRRPAARRDRRRRRRRRHRRRRRPRRGPGARLGPARPSIRTRGGGAGANVAVHLARLGTTVGWSAAWATTPPASGSIAELAAAGVRPALRTVPGASDRHDREPRGARRAAQHARRPRREPGTRAGRRRRSRGRRHLHLSGLHAAAPAAAARRGSAALARRSGRVHRLGRPGLDGAAGGLRGRPVAGRHGRRRRCCCPTPTRHGC